MTQKFRYCPSCGAALHGRYCSECGFATDRPAAQAPGIHWPYVIVGASALALLGALVMRQARSNVVGQTPAAVTATAATPATSESVGRVQEPPSAPRDLSAMTPRERFDALFDRVMRASEGGDTATVATFSPMALAAYGMLDTPDIDARFHAGLLKLAARDLVGASTMADSIAAEQPGHLFGTLLQGRIAEQQQNHAALEEAQRKFLAAYPAETAAQRPEYPGHQALIDRFFKEAAP